MAKVTTIKKNGKTSVRFFSNREEAEKYYNKVKNSGEIHAIQN